MTKILLSCDSDDFDIALDLKFTIQERLNFKVMLDVESWRKEENNNLRAESTPSDLDIELISADVLLVFYFGDSNISAWVMFEDSDVILRKQQHAPNDDDDDDSYFPDCIDFSKSFKRGIRVFESILRNDYGLVVAQPRQ